MVNPAFFIPIGDQAPATVVRFCPFYFEKNPESTDTGKYIFHIDSSALIELPYKMVFAILTLNQVLIYSTESTLPIAVVSNLHYDSLTDASWNEDKNLVITSKDGFCSIISFEKNEFGKRLNSSEIENPLI